MTGGEPRVVCEGDTCFILQEGQLGLLHIYDLGAEFVVIEWDKAGYEKFQIEIKEPGAEDWRTLSDSLTGSLMRKKNLSPGERYDFRGRGWNKTQGNWSDWSPVRSIVTLSEVSNSSKLGSPSVVGNELMPDGSKSVMTVQWPEAPAGSLYQVEYRQMGKQGEWAAVNTLLKGNMMRKKNIEPGNDWVFRVRWRGESAGDDAWSEWSSPSSPVATLVVHNAMVSHFGNDSSTLRRADGSFVDSKCLAGKVVFLYFSAHWCPPCRQFTPQLAQIYNHARAQGKPIEVVFVSADRDLSSFNEYAASMPWLSVAYNSPKRNEIMQRYQVNGIPNLKVLAPNGTILSDNAVQGMSLAMIDTFVKQCGL